MSEPTTQSPVHAPAQLQAEGQGHEGGVSMAPPAFQLKAGPAAPIQKKDPDAPEPAAPAGMTPQEKELTGQFDPAKHKDFVKVEGEHMLRREVAVAYHQMQSAATGAGFKMTLVSSTRNYEKQKAIWDAKWDRDDFKGKKAGKERAEAIMEYSSMPGTSRHHWGTDMDINSVAPSQWVDAEGKKPAGPYNKLYKWMLKNAASFGFCQTYDKKGSGAGERSSGYNEERWHWSYIPLADGYQKAYTKEITNDEVAGLDFKGASSAKDVDAVGTYVNSVSADCKDVNALGRPQVKGTVKVTATKLSLRSTPSTKGGVLGSILKDVEKNYFEVKTEKGGNVWLLLEEGWIGQTVDKKENATMTPNAPASQPAAVPATPTEEKK